MKAFWLALALLFWTGQAMAQLYQNSGSVIPSPTLKNTQRVAEESDDTSSVRQHTQGSLTITVKTLSEQIHVLQLNRQLWKGRPLTLERPFVSDHYMRLGDQARGVLSILDNNDAVISVTFLPRNRVKVETGPAFFWEDVELKVRDDLQGYFTTGIVPFQVAQENTSIRWLSRPVKRKPQARLFYFNRKLTSRRVTVCYPSVIDERSDLWQMVGVRGLAIARQLSIGGIADVTLHHDRALVVLDPECAWSELTVQVVADAITQAIEGASSTQHL